MLAADDLDGDLRLSGGKTRNLRGDLCLGGGLAALQIGGIDHMDDGQPRQEI